MVFGMATSKITITLDREQLKSIKALIASGRTPNTSAFIKHAVTVALHDVAGWGVMLSEALEQTGGPLTSRERAWADEALIPERTKSKRQRKAA